MYIYIHIYGHVLHSCVATNPCACIPRTDKAQRAVEARKHSGRVSEAKTATSTADIRKLSKDSHQYG